MARFRWAQCQLDALETCDSLDKLHETLAALPPTLDQTYERILSAISEDESKYAIRILQWLTFAVRPLLAEEVAEVAAISITRHPVFDENEVLLDPLKALRICSGLVTITTDKSNDEFPRRIIALAHYSVKEYLVSERIKQSGAARYSMSDTECHSIIATGCLKYLLQFKQEIPSSRHLQDFKLARYTAEFWLKHAQQSGERISKLSRIVLDLFSTENPAYYNWLGLYNPDPEKRLEELNNQQGLDKPPVPLYYAALSNLYHVVILLLQKGIDVNSKGGCYGNPLQAASAGGNEQMVELLLKNNADVNTKGGYYENSLQAASAEGHENVVKVLLDHGAQINAQGGRYGTALQAASAEGHLEVVMLLLDRGAKVNTAENGRYGNPLQAASAEEHEQVVKLLLSKGANVNAQSNGFTALSVATISRNTSLIETLLAAGADIHTALKTLEPMDTQSSNAGLGNFLKQSALLFAAASANERMIKMLLDAGADANGTLERSLKTPLHFAAESGRLNVVRILLDANADPTREDELGRTASDYTETATSRSEIDEIKRELLLCNKEFQLALYVICAGGKT